MVYIKLTAEQKLANALARKQDAIMLRGAKRQLGLTPAPKRKSTYVRLTAEQKLANALARKQDAAMLRGAKRQLGF